MQASYLYSIIKKSAVDTFYGIVLGFELRVLCLLGSALPLEGKRAAALFTFGYFFR
jgi:hypothetical protein